VAHLGVAHLDVAHLDVAHLSVPHYVWDNFWLSVLTLKKFVHHKSTYPNFRFSPDNPSPGILQPDCNFGLQLFLKTIKN